MFHRMCRHGHHHDVLKRHTDGISWRQFPATTETLELTPQTRHQTHHTQGSIVSADMGTTTMSCDITMTEFRRDSSQRQPRHYQGHQIHDTQSSIVSADMGTTTMSRDTTQTESRTDSSQPQPRHIRQHHSSETSDATFDRICRHEHHYYAL